MLEILGMLGMLGPGLVIGEALFGAASNFSTFWGGDVKNAK